MNWKTKQNKNHNLVGRINWKQLEWRIFLQITDFDWVTKAGTFPPYNLWERSVAPDTRMRYYRKTVHPDMNRSNHTNGNTLADR